MRKLEVPTVLDRLIQQAVLQVLQRRWDAGFPITVTGFDPGARRIRRSPVPSNISLRGMGGW